MTRQPLRLLLPGVTLSLLFAGCVSPPDPGVPAGLVGNGTALPTDVPLDGLPGDGMPTSLTTPGAPTLPGTPTLPWTGTGTTATGTTAAGGTTTTAAGSTTTAGGTTTASTSSTSPPPPPPPPPGPPAQLVVSCTITATVGVLPQPCSPGSLVSSTGADFTAASATLAWTGTAVAPVTFRITNPVGTTLATVTGTTSPLAATVPAGSVPTGTPIELRGTVSATSFVGFTGTVTFTVS